MDANYAIDEQMGSVEFDVGQIPMEQTVLKTFSFNEVNPVCSNLTILHFLTCALLFDRHQKST